MSWRIPELKWKAKDREKTGGVIMSAFDKKWDPGCMGHPSPSLLVCGGLGLLPDRVLRRGDCLGGIAASVLDGGRRYIVELQLPSDAGIKGGHDNAG